MVCCLFYCCIVITGWEGLHPSDSRWGTVSSDPWPQEPVQHASDWRIPGCSASLWPPAVSWVGIGTFIYLCIFVSLVFYCLVYRLLSLCRMVQRSEGHSLSVKTFQNIPVEHSSVMVSWVSKSLFIHYPFFSSSVSVKGGNSYGTLQVQYMPLKENTFETKSV